MRERKILSVLLPVLLFTFGFCLLACDDTADSAADSKPISDDDDNDDNDNNDNDDNDDNDNDDNDDTTPLPPPTVKTLSWITVKDRRLVDEYGRHWLPNGINARVAGLFDGNDYWSQAVAEYTDWDAAAMVRDGYSLFRLPINWSGIEPIEGEIDEAYLQKIDQVVAWAGDAGLYVLIDFHQDKYSKYIGDDGAPLWAHYPPYVPGDDKVDISWRLALAVFAFFTDYQNLQERWLPAWQVVVARYAALPQVIGFEPYNEPESILPDWLYEFYYKAASGLRAIDTRHTLWLEPDVLRNNLLWAPLRREPFPDDNLVYEPHLYPNFIGMNYETVDEWLEAITPTYDRALTEAASWGNAATVVGEWGTHPGDAYAPAYFAATRRLADERGIGLAFWVWKEKSSGNWGLFDYDPDTDTWTQRTGPGMDELLRPTILAVPGRLIAQTWDAETGELTVEFAAAGGEGPPLVYLPEGVFPDGFTADLNGESLSLTVDDETRRALVPWDGQAGEFTLTIRATD
ncbi:MAG: glycoside hydrolase family 5 protein [Myxococcales bacterium]|nr:glycoside hydrolase family 5 protein [Myxococcales bacterium]